jgi:hypothetical protein
LADAIAQEPKHPKIEVLERRLKIAMTEQMDKPEVAAEPKVSVSNDELERMVRGMPQGTVEAFTHTIQPLLLNNCTNAGCHNRQETSQFSLLRMQGRTASRRMTHVNLHATIAQIDNADPEKSSLLLMAVQSHGGSRAPVFSSRDVMQYLQLRQWVHHVSRGRVPLEVQTPLATSLDKQPEPLLQSMPNQTPPGMTVTTSAPPVTAEPPQKAEEKKAIEYVPVDPYDPEIFNRQLLR